MEQIYLENARQIFLIPPRDGYYEGMGAQKFDNFIRMLAYIIPNRLTPEELVVYLKFLINDIKNQNCGFQNSQAFKYEFQKYLSTSGNLDMWMTYFIGFVQTIAPPEFAIEFIELFRASFFQLDKNDKKEEDYGCIEVEPDVIDISNKDKAEVLASLYNHSKPLGKGIVQYDPTPMTVDVARVLLKKMGYSFGYLKGRTMKVNLEGDTIWVSRYNADNNHPGLAQMAISKCRNIESKINSGTLKK